MELEPVDPRSPEVRRAKMRTLRILLWVVLAVVLVSVHRFSRGG